MTTLSNETMNRQQSPLAERLLGRAEDALQQGWEALSFPEPRRADLRRASLALKALGVTAANAMGCLTADGIACCQIGHAAGLQFDAWADLLEASEMLARGGIRFSAPGTEELRRAVETLLTEAQLHLFACRAELQRQIEDALAEMDEPVAHYDHPEFALDEGAAA